MSDNSTVFDGKIGEIKQDWSITKSQIETKFDTEINTNTNINNISDDATGFIRINDYKGILGIDDKGNYTGEHLKVLKNIVDVSLVDLKAEIDKKVDILIGKGIALDDPLEVRKEQIAKIL